jgi:DNA-binding winged helix-turn-helix (wHTH) protein/Tfp pilus assembly protein PilF
MDTDRGHFVFQFGDFELDPSQRTVVARPDGRRVKMTPRVYDTLLYLVEHAGRPVTKNELLQEVWAGVIVEEGNLTQTIHVLRRALRESPQEHRYVVTVPRRGYQFVAGVHTVRVVPPSPQAPTPRVRPWVRVAKVALAAGLLLTSSGGLLFDPDDGGDGIEKRVQGETLAAPRDAMADPRADALRSQAQYLFHRRGAEDLLRARRNLERALALAPRDAAAAALLAGVMQSLGAAGLLDRDAARAGQRKAAERALQLDATLPEAHLRMAQLLWNESDAAAAQRHFERGVALGPDRPLALSMQAGLAARRGDLRQAIELQQRSVALEPLAAVQRANLGTYLLAEGRLLEAEAEFRLAQALNPELADAEIALTLVLRRSPEAALERILRWAPGPARDQALVLAYDALGRASAAEAALERLRADPAPENAVRLAEVLAMRGKREEAFDGLLRALAADGSDGTGADLELESRELALRLSPFLVDLRQDRRWSALLARG